MCLMNSTNEQRGNRSRTWGDGPNGGWKDAGREEAMAWCGSTISLVWWRENSEARVEEESWGYYSLQSCFGFFFWLFGFGPFGFFLFSSKMQKEEKLFCSPGWLPLDRAVSQGLLGLGKCRTAKLSFAGQLGKNRDGTLNCSFCFLNKSLTIKTASCRGLRSLPSSSKTVLLYINWGGERKTTQACSWHFLLPSKRTIMTLNYWLQCRTQCGISLSYNFTIHSSLPISRAVCFILQTTLG